MLKPVSEHAEIGNSIALLPATPQCPPDLSSRV